MRLMGNIAMRKVVLGNVLELKKYDEVEGMMRGRENVPAFPATDLRNTSPGPVQ